MGIYHRPGKVKDALAVLAASNARPVAGCTDVFAAMENQELSGDVVDVTRLQELKGVREDSDGWRIGAATTWREISQLEMPRAFEMLLQSGREIGGVQVQNSGTIGGNICNASPAADGVPPLLALDASVELMSVRGTRYIRLNDFLTGAGRSVCQKDELVSAILIPKSSGTGHSRFLKLGARKHLVISIAMVAVRLDVENSVIKTAAIAVGACGPVAKRAFDLENALIGAEVGEAAGLVSKDNLASIIAPISDIRATAEYRAEAALELIRRGLLDVAGSFA
ncbi:MAG: FAD binding domain-containing protein [Shimia sp.]|uniref:FAD binding domain-containing protein n=1 Tax=Shimia sp. TaxID=1954381 RepID=UPI001B05F6EC|nr:FAD binding domain-containing protein [Shimia sp.]MBO6897872.1 FAD binding domain-containing protein [Shimia sp.]